MTLEEFADFGIDAVTGRKTVYSSRVPGSSCLPDPKAQRIHETSGTLSSNTLHVVRR